MILRPLLNYMIKESVLKAKKSKIWFSSDHHFGHQNIIKYCKRPFKDVIEMDEKLISNWNECVSKDDVVYYLGDFCFYKDIDVVKKRLKSLNGKKHLILGNHEDTFKVNTWVSAGFYSVHTSLSLSHLGHQLYLAHTPESKKQLGLSDVIFVHGHVHNNTPAIYEDDLREIIVNVCVENWSYRPIEINELFEKIRVFREASL